MKSGHKLVLHPFLRYVGQEYSYPPLGVQLKASLKPPNTIVSWYSSGFRGPLKWSPIRSSGASLSNGCAWDRCEDYTKKSFQDLIKSNCYQIVFTIYRLIWNQMDVRFIRNQSENDEYNLILVWLNKISKIFICVYILKACIMRGVRSVRRV